MSLPPINISRALRDSSGFSRATVIHETVLTANKIETTNQDEDCGNEVWVAQPAALHLWENGQGSAEHLINHIQTEHLRMLKCRLKAPATRKSSSRNTVSWARESSLSPPVFSCETHVNGALSYSAFYSQTVPCCVASVGHPQLESSYC